MSETFSKDSVRSSILEVFSRHAVDSKSVTEASHITGDLGVDSLAVMEIVAELEDQYNLSFPDEDLPKVRTVGDVVSIVEQHLQAEGRLS